MKKVRAALWLLAVIGLAIVAESAYRELGEDNDDITILMFDENGDVRTDDLARVAHYARFQ